MQIKKIKCNHIFMRLFVAYFLICSILTGCSISTEITPSNISEAEKRQKITFMMPQSHYRDFMQHEIEYFEQAYPEYEIEVQKIPDNQWIDVVKAKAATCEMPDIIRIDRGLLEDIGIEKFLKFDNTEKWYGRVLEEQRSNKEIGGMLYGMPVGSTSSIGLVCNMDLFEEYGLKPPKTMEEMRNICRVFKQSGITPLYASDKDSWTSHLNFCIASTQIMPEEMWLALKENQIKWSEVPEFTDILNDFLKLRLDGYTNSDYLQATYDSAVASMADGKTAMYICGQFFINDVEKYNKDICLAMVPGPYNGNVLTVLSGLGMFAVSADSKQIEGAKIFLEWFSQPDNMDEFNAGWNHYPVFQDQKMQYSNWQKNLYENYISQGKTQIELEEIFSGIDMNDFWSYQQDMLAGRISAQEVLHRWDSNYERQMREKGLPGW